MEKIYSKIDQNKLLHVIVRKLVLEQHLFQINVKYEQAIHH
jgi:hypothetical protein